MPPALNTTKGEGRLPKPPLRPDPWTHPYPAHPSSGSQQGNLLLVLAPPCCSRSPNKALPEFLVWLLINFY